MKLTTMTFAAFVAMAGTVSAETAPGDVVFDEYGAVADSLSGVPGNAEEGAKVWGSKKIGNCVACHQISSMEHVPFHGEIGPSLDGVGDRWSVAEIRGIVTNAKKTYDGTLMPSYYKVEGFIRPGKAYTGKAADDTFGPLLSAQQIEDVVAFLATLKE